MGTPPNTYMEPKTCGTVAALAELQPSLTRYHFLHFLGAHTSMIFRKSGINNPCCKTDFCEQFSLLMMAEMTAGMYMAVTCNDVPDGDSNLLSLMRSIASVTRLRAWWLCTLHCRACPENNESSRATGRMTIPRMARKIYLDWVTERHAEWDINTPAKEEDLSDRYNIPATITTNRATWPASCKHLGATLKITVDITNFPWGKPAYALQQTLAKASGYTTDVMYTEDAMKALRHIERTYFSTANRAKLSPTNLDNWPLSLGANRYLTRVLMSIGATTATPPAFIK
ncbi:hypothetical protein CNMCM8927_008512 [Aspergillus lentulus]|uniref:Uncharacterized protein n=1 Tax=Aspergillus lentulus TaxID=293939 RepID=A0AAN5YNU2_ASPLE|nr:hypothetical protein CNMCM8060_002268 [Aspergillus lentulus]KAF4199617.1 hypothetical protein CNMCM8694_003366 [Aspergillus lentulus]KAF4203654.1 hypothetical protein CNMCM8927_008512 [Aspergillus lentulus]